MKQFKFPGFEPPQQNYSKLPHGFVECLPYISSIAELKVVIYLLRHTWGFSEYGKPKRITNDEFMHGRKRRDGTRVDGGTGLSKHSVIDGLEKAIKHGFILVEVDDTDKARVEKHYCLNMSGVQILHPGVQNLHIEGAKFAHRSEKETSERKEREEEEEQGDPALATFELYESEIGTLTPYMKKTIREAVKTYSLKWVQDAMREASMQGKRNWKYCRSILERWGQQGDQEPDDAHKLKSFIRKTANGKRSRSAAPQWEPVGISPERQEELRRLAADQLMGGAG